MVEVEVELESLGALLLFYNQSHWLSVYSVNDGNHSYNFIHGSTLVARA